MRSFEIGEEPDRFQHRFLEILGLIHDHYEAPAREHLVKQNLIQFIVHGDETHSSGFDAKLAEDVAKELARIALSLEEKDSARGVGKFLHEAVEKGSLAHARVGDERHESAVVFDTVEECIQSFAVRAAQIKIVGVRGNAERLLTETIE